MDPKPMRSCRLVFAAAVCLLSRHLGAQAQGAAPNATTASRIAEVQIDRNSAAFGGVLPFDEPFVLTGAAPTSLLRLDVWYGDSTSLSRDSCQTVSKKDSVIKGVVHGQRPDERPRIVYRHAVWVRNAGAATTFWIPIGTLPPNRPFTFCFKSVEALTAADSATFVALASDGLRRLLLSNKLGTRGLQMPESTLHAFHTTLRNALPKRDSLVFPDGSVLGQLPAKPDPAFDTLIARTFVSFVELNANRLGAADHIRLRASSRRHPIDPNAPPADTTLCVKLSPTPAEAGQQATKCDRPLGWLLRELSRQATLDTLVRLADGAVSPRIKTEPAPPAGEGQSHGGTTPRPQRTSSTEPSATTVPLTKAESDHLVGALILARRLRRTAGALDGVQAEAIAYGMSSIADPRYPSGGNANLPTRWNVAELTAWAANLDTTIAHLDDLRGLIALVYHDSMVNPSTGDAAQLAAAARRRDSLMTLDSFVGEAFIAANDQRSDMRLLLGTHAAFDRTIASLVEGLAARDLKAAGLFSTTSANYEARARWYVGQDLGAIYGFRGKDTRQASPYLGLNIYKRPINKRAPKPVFCPFDSRCTSLSVGIPTDTWQEDDRFTGILAGRPLVVGLGTRIGDFLRVSYDRPLVYRYAFPANAPRRRVLSSMSAVSVTLDADLREIISGVANAIFPK